jgi:putative ABC transport system substrate-binding protein
MQARRENPVADIASGSWRKHMAAGTRVVSEESPRAVGCERAAGRRAVLLGCAGLIAAPSLAQVRATAKVFRIGLLGGSSRQSAEAGHIWAALFQGLRALGYVEGRNLEVEERWYGDSVERLPALAEDLVRQRPDLIVAGTSPSPEQARRATSIIPIVMLNHGDPVGSGLVASLAKPGGNVTGMSLNVLALRAAQLQILKETLPKVVSVAVLSNPTVDFRAFEMRQMESAARTLKMELQLVEASASGEFAPAFAAARNSAGAIFVLGNSLFFSYRAEIARLAAQHRLPAMYGPKEFVEAGGLMCYGVNFADIARQVAAYVDKILKGARPADLPIQEPTRFEMMVNLRTAKELGLAIPGSILARADRIIR